MELKYIITEHNSIAMFSPTCNHNDMARGMHGRPVSAGFCNIRQEADSDRVNVHCYGKSVTLKLDSREGDEHIINRHINPFK